MKSFSDMLNVASNYHLFRLLAFGELFFLCCVWQIRLTRENVDQTCTNKTGLDSEIEFLLP